MKRFIALVLSLVMALSLCAPAWAEVASPTDLEGNGTAESPYLVDTEAELAAAIEKGGTVVLTNEVIISESLPVTKNTVLDLNGKKIGTSGSTTGSPLYLQGGELTVKNGTLDLDGKLTNVNGTFSVAIGYEAQTKLVVENVNFTGKTAINGAVVVDGPLNIAISDCTMDVTKSGIVVSANSTEAIATINNCNIDADEYAVFASQGSKITINGGTYKSVGKVITSMYDNTVVTINGGTFDGELWVTGGGSLVIKGGTFNDDPTDYVPKDGWYTITEGTDTWTVTKKDPVAKIGEVEYKTLAEAVAAAASAPDKTVTLLKDVTVATTVVLDGITLDGGNHKLIADAALGGMATDVKNNTYTVVKSNDGCTIKNLTIKGGWKGILIEPTATLDTLLENVTIVESCRGINFNNIADSNVKLTVKNSTLSGWCGVQAAGTIAFENTTFVKNASVRGSGLDPYGAITLTNCTFDAGTVLTAEDIPAGKAIAISNGIYNGELEVVDGKGTFSITGGTFAADPTPYVADGYAAFKDGEKYTVKAVVAKIGDVPYASLQDAVTAVKNGETINVVVAGQTATVNEAKSFTVTGADATITADKGFQLTKDGNKCTVVELYTITFKVNGGSGEMAADSAVAGKYTPPTKCDFTAPSGYKFKGWSTTPDGVVITSLNVTDDVNLYAIWSIEVPVSAEENKNTVHVDAVVNETTATLDTVAEAELDKVIGEQVDTGTVTIDFSKLTGTEETETGTKSAPIDTVVIPTTVIEQIAEAATTHGNDTEGLEIVLGDGVSIEFDAVALASKADLLTGDDVTISVKPTDDADVDLEDAQKKTIGDCPAYDITVTSGGSNVFGIGEEGGIITLSAPYALKDGESAWGINVYYVDENGNKEWCKTSYDGKTVTWETSHLSVYMIEHESYYGWSGYYPVVGGTSSSTADKTVTSAKTFDAGIGMYVAMSVMAAAGSAVVIGKKRED